MCASVPNPAVQWNVLWELVKCREVSWVTHVGIHTEMCHFLVFFSLGWSCISKFGSGPEFGDLMSWVSLLSSQGMSCHKRASINCSGQSLVLHIDIILLPAGSRVLEAVFLSVPGELAAACSRNTCAGAYSPPSHAGRTGSLAGLQSFPASQGPQGVRHLSGTQRDWENAAPHFFLPY